MANPIRSRFGPSKSGRAALANAALAVASLCGALVACEAVLRLLKEDRHAVWPPGIHRVLHPTPDIMPGIAGPSNVTTSSEGLRADPEPAADAVRIIAIGGSTTECLYLDDREAWPRLLQDMLNETSDPGRHVWIGNAGRSGHNTRHHIVQTRFLAEEFPRLDAFLVLAGANDLLQRLGLDDRYRPFPGVPNLAPDEYQALMSRAFAIWPAADAEASFVRRTQLWNGLRSLWRRVVQPPPAPEVLDEAGRIYVTWRRHRAASTRIRASLPDLSAALEEFQGNLRAIIAAARSRQLDVFLITPPALWHASLSQEELALLWMGGVGNFQGVPGQPYYSPAALAEGLARYRDAVLRVCDETGAPCLDLAGELPRSLDIFYDDMHFNENGAREVARRLARLLRENGGTLRLEGRALDENRRGGLQ